MDFKHTAPEPASGSTLDYVRAIFSEDWFAAKCFNVWEAHLQWLHEDLGWSRAYEQQTISPDVFGEATGHEVVNLLNDFIFQTGYVNAHLGLTSSDVVDNVRLMQVYESLDCIVEALKQFNQHLYAYMDCSLETVGFTHWQPAAPIIWSHRVGAWLDPLVRAIDSVPRIHAKKFGGPVGDAASLQILAAQCGTDVSEHPFDWSIFDLYAPRNPFPLQSSDHTCEMEAVAWCCRVAAQIHKIALDLRFLASHGLVVLERPKNHAGSSSMPHKLNPHKWEKVCSMCRAISTTQLDLWQVAAHNSLERTLDTSWQIKRALFGCFTMLAEVIDEMTRLKFSVGSNGATLLREHRNLLSSDRDLMRQVLSGKTRFDAYLSALKSHQT